MGVFPGDPINPINPELMRFFPGIKLCHGDGGISPPPTVPFIGMGIPLLLMGVPRGSHPPRAVPPRYSSSAEFAADALLVFDNCQTFNEDDSAVGRAGHAMRRFFQSRWEEFYQGKLAPNP